MLPETLLLHLVTLFLAFVAAVAGMEALIDSHWAVWIDSHVGDGKRDGAMRSELVEAASFGVGHQVGCAAFAYKSMPAEEPAWPPA